jgi:hypothetical protein
MPILSKEILMPTSVEEAVERPILNELVTWVKTLTSAGVSPDKAVEVASDFLAMAFADGDEEEWDEVEEN